MDIVFCPLTNFEKRRSNEVELHTIKCSSSVLVVSENHRLANRASVSMAELAGEELVTFFRKDSVVHSDLIMQFCKEGGFSARISYEVSDINTFLLIIAANMAVGFAGATIEDILPPGSGIKLLPVHELSTNKLNIGAAWKKDNPNEVLAMLIRVVRQLYPDISEKGK